MTRRTDIARLRKRRDFLAAAGGRKWAATGLVLQALDRADETEPRVGFTVTKKVGGAVVRNRARRRLKAAASEILPVAAKQGYDYVLVGRASTLTRAWPDLLDDLRAAMTKVHGARLHGPQRSARGHSSQRGSEDRSGSESKEDTFHG
ncbi:ribonuclease P protein component [Parvibaculum sp.]|uniref:ribonuclease P protein component n=1 Tax=Parvibaculum sp. TaxID=2024848 RepID=UPI002CFB909A|nr:ribonuclease P protein component [Parvibaculum sp.]HUD50675.1 ribonuclease P protein component [Parvibaculum sp.]